MHKRIQSTKFLEKKRRQGQVIFYLGVISFFTLSASAILLLRAPFFQVTHVDVEGSILVPQEAVGETALSSLGGNYWNIIPRTNTLFISKSSILEAVQKKYTEIEDFTIHRAGLSGLRLTLRERVPAAVVCSGFRIGTEEDKCLWSDDRGFVFGVVVGSSSPVYNRYYVPGEKEIELGTHFISPDRFSALQKFFDGVGRGGLIPLGVLVSEDGQYEMYIKNEKGDSEVTVYFDGAAAFDVTLDNLLAFWQNTVKGKQASSTPIFDYINLRFGNTVYYSAD